ncbi:MAG: antitoxin [Desulfamplus sp.]|nr:antitoxin [Desulfamplus sp.]
MEIAKSFITDEKGNIISVILDYHIFQKLEEIILDNGLLKAMLEVEDDESLSYKEVKEMIQQL